MGFPRRLTATPSPALSPNTSDLDSANPRCALVPLCPRLFMWTPARPRGGQAPALRTIHAGARGPRRTNKAGG